MYSRAFADQPSSDQTLTVAAQTVCWSRFLESSWGPADGAGDAAQVRVAPLRDAALLWTIGVTCVLHQGPDAADRGLHCHTGSARLMRKCRVHPACTEDYVTASVHAAGVKQTIIVRIPARGLLAVQACCNASFSSHLRPWEQIKYLKLLHSCIQPMLLYKVTYKRSRKTRESLPALLPYVSVSELLLQTSWCGTLSESQIGRVLLLPSQDSSSEPSTSTSERKTAHDSSSLWIIWAVTGGFSSYCYIHAFGDFHHAIPGNWFHDTSFELQYMNVQICNIIYYSAKFHSETCSANIYLFMWCQTLYPLSYVPS